MSAWQRLVGVVTSGVLMALGTSWASGQCLQEAKITPADAEADDHCGTSVAIDGDVAVVGSPNDDDAVFGSDAGSVTVFRLGAGVWSQETELVASDGASGDSFGHDVAVDGNVLVVGSPFDDDSGSGSGSVYVYRWDGANWNEEQKLGAADGATFDRLGISVDVSGDVIVAGAYTEDASGSNSGSAYIFRYDGATWSQEQKLVASDGSSDDLLGFSVSVSGDVAVAGSYQDDDDGSKSGSAYVFRWDGASWNEEVKLTASDASAGDEFGYSVDTDGTTIIVGAHKKDVVGSDEGGAYVFRWNGVSWLDDGAIEAVSGQSSDRLGTSVAIDGDLAVVGALQGDGMTGDTGLSYLFRFTGIWVQEATRQSSDGDAGDDFGGAVAVDGSLVLIGADEDDDDGSNSGSAYVFSSGVLASWTNYGKGWAGTLGIPSFGASDVPVLGTTIDLQVENSLGSRTYALFLIGNAASSLPTPWGGSLLVGPFDVSTLQTLILLDAGLNTLSYPIADDPSLRGDSRFFQVLQWDEGASQGVSSTAGLELLFGDC